MNKLGQKFSVNFLEKDLGLPYSGELKIIDFYNGAALYNCIFKYKNKYYSINIEIIDDDEVIWEEDYVYANLVEKRKVTRDVWVRVSKEPIIKNTKDLYKMFTDLTKNL
jgi:hypothetical protein